MHSGAKEPESPKTTSEPEDLETFGQKNGQNMPKNCQRQAINKWSEEQTKSDAATGRTYSFPDDEPDHEEIMNSVTRNLETGLQR